MNVYEANGAVVKYLQETRPTVTDTQREIVIGISGGHIVEFEDRYTAQQDGSGWHFGCQCLQGKWVCIAF